jgi:hypothetical protein
VFVSLFRANTISAANVQPLIVSCARASFCAGCSGWREAATRKLSSTRGSSPLASVSSHRVRSRCQVLGSGDLSHHPDGSSAMQRPTVWHLLARDVDQPHPHQRRHRWVRCTVVPGTLHCCSGYVALLFCYQSAKTQKRRVPLSAEGSFAHFVPISFVAWSCLIHTIRGMVVLNSHNSWHGRA